MRNALIGFTFTMLLAGCMTDEDVARKQAYDNRPQMGVAFEPEWWSENTVVIRDVGTDTAGERAGLKNMDQIISFDKHPVTTLESLEDLELAAKHGQVVEVGILRGGRPYRAMVELQ